MAFAPSIGVILLPCELSSGARPQVRARTTEQAVAQVLADRGWRILAQRWRRRGLEIDLVAAKGQTLAIVEVKARRRPLAWAADAAAILPPRKWSALRRGAVVFTQSCPAAMTGGPWTIRIDLAIVEPLWEASAQGERWARRARLSYHPGIECKGSTRRD